MASDTAEAADGAADAATDMASDTAEAVAAPMADTAELNALLTTEGWDAPKVVEAIDASDLDTLRKTGLKTLVEAAPESGPLLDAAIETVRQALNVDG